MSEERITYEAMLKELGQISYRCMLYGEWLRDECEECHTRENVRKYAERSGKWKGPIYLCDTCASPGMKHLREWTAEE